MNSLMNLFTRKTPQQETKDLAKDANKQAMATSSTIAGTIAHTSKAMGSMNKAMDHAKVGEMMAQFSQQSDQMAIKEQTVDEAFEALDGDVDWEAEDETLAMVMDELGLEVAGTMSAVPKTQAAAAARSQSQPAAAQLGVADFS